MWLISSSARRAVFINPNTTDVWQEGDKYKRLNLAKTLERIADNGAEEFYSGETGQNLVKDIQEAGGIITLDDLKNYEYAYLLLYPEPL